MTEQAGLNLTQSLIHEDVCFQCDMAPMYVAFQVILSIGLSWILCLILTTTDAIPNNTTHPNYGARTDARLTVVDTAPWFYWPYPCKYSYIIIGMKTKI